MLKVSYETKDQMSLLTLEGPMDESAAKALRDCLPAMAKDVRIDFSQVEYFNSLGIRAWVNFLRNLLDGRKVSYVNCPMDFIQQISMLPFLSRGVSIDSFFVDFACDACGFETKLHFSCKSGREKLLEEISAQSCERCQSSLRSEEDPQTLTLFMAS